MRILQILAGRYLPRFCPNCGIKIAYEDPKFCPDCGYALTIETVQTEMASPETKFDTTYPLPDDVRNFSKPLRGNSLNFQTSMSLEQIATFYQRAFTERGLFENESFTNITEDSISLVFNVTDDDDLVVLQAVDLAYGTNMDLRNVNLRTEKRSVKEEHVEPAEEVVEVKEGEKSRSGVWFAEKKPVEEAVEEPHDEKAIEAPVEELTEEPTEEAAKEPLEEKEEQTKKYVVYVDDNFHYRDESERYKLGDFETCEEAVTACKKIVDEYFERGYEKGISFKELYGGYTTFGEDPFIVSDDEKCRFSAWDYAKKRSRELCGEE